jgi:hypothetical protein
VRAAGIKRIAAEEYFEFAKEMTGEYSEALFNMDKIGLLARSSEEGSAEKL